MLSLIIDLTMDGETVEAQTYISAFPLTGTGQMVMVPGTEFLSIAEVIVYSG